MVEWKKSQNNMCNNFCLLHNPQKIFRNILLIPKNKMEISYRACYVHGCLDYQDSLWRNDRNKATQTLNNLYLSLY